MFLTGNVCLLFQISLWNCSQGSIWQRFIVSSANTLTPNRWNYGASRKYLCKRTQSVDRTSLFSSYCPCRTLRFLLLKHHWSPWFRTTNLSINLFSFLLWDKRYRELKKIMHTAWKLECLVTFVTDDFTLILNIYTYIYIYIYHWYLSTMPIPYHLLTPKRLGHFYKNVISFRNVVHHKCVQWMLFSIVDTDGLVL